MSQNEQPAGPRDLGLLRLARWVRVALAVAGLGLMIVASFGLLALKLDGVGVTSFVLCGAVLAGVGLLGRLPTQLKLKDVEMSWQLQREEDNAIELAASKPDIDDPSLAERASIDESPADLTLPLFEDSSRLTELVSISPKAALLAIYGELEEQIKGLARDAGLPTEGRKVEHLRQVTTRLVQTNWLSGWHANAVRSLSNARNAVAHSPSDVPDVEVTALLDLAAQMARDVKVRRRAAMAGYTPRPESGPVAAL